MLALYKHVGEIGRRVSKMFVLGQRMHSKNKSYVRLHTRSIMTSPLHGEGRAFESPRAHLFFVY